jgi:hypothetical protein
MTIVTHPAKANEGKSGSPVEVLLAFLRLGLTCFGGPIAHIGYFREEFVGRRRWLDEHAYADLVGLCQFLPGPASSQVGFSIGLMRAGYVGGLAAWAGFTLPSRSCSLPTARARSVVRSALAYSTASSSWQWQSSPMLSGVWREFCAPTGSARPLPSWRR